MCIRDSFLGDTIQHSDGIRIVSPQFGVGQLLQGTFFGSLAQRLLQLCVFLFQLSVLGGSGCERHLILQYRDYGNV